MDGTTSQSEEKRLDLTLNANNKLSVEVDPNLPDLDLSLRDPTSSESWHGDVCTFHLKLKEKNVPQDNSAKEGWGFVNASPKAHYFVDGKSLCGKWLILGKTNLEQGKDESPDNCTGCKKALRKRKARDALRKLDEQGKMEF